MAISTVLWLACAPALTASFAALVVAACVLHAKTGATAALVASAVLVLLLRFRLADAGARARILSGHSPFGCFAAPKTVEAFVDRLCAVWHATDGRPAVVGSGWGWFIGRARAPNAVFTHNLQGRIGKLAFLAGTELRDGRGDAAQAVRPHVLVARRPCSASPSGRGWRAAVTATPAPPASPAATRRRACSSSTSPRSRRRARARAGRSTARCKPRFDEEPGRFVDRGRGVRLRAHERRTIWLQEGANRRRLGTTRPRSQGLREWLTPDAVLRVLFFGSARRDLALGVTYVPFDPDGARGATFTGEFCGCCGRMVPHIDPHDCSAGVHLVCSWTRARSCAAGTSAPSASWRGVIRLSDANAFSPDPSWLALPIIALLSGTVNYELIFLLPQLVAPTLRSQRCRVQKLCNALLKLYEQIWGRCELRMGGLDKGLVFVDCITRERDAPSRHRRAQAAHAPADGRFARRQVSR